MGRALGFALLVIAGLAPSAAAATTEYPASFIDVATPGAAEAGGPVLMGPDVAWADHGVDGSLQVRVAGPGVATRTVFTAPGGIAPSFRTVQLSAAPGRLAIASLLNHVSTGKYEDPGFPISTTVLTGSADGPASVAMDCPGGLAAVAVSERALVTGNFYCGASIVVRRFDGGTAPVLPDAASPLDVAAAGRFVAWRAGPVASSPIVVWDLDAGAEAYRVDATSVVPGWILRDDGRITAVLSGVSLSFCTLATASPADPVLAGAPVSCSARPLAIAGDRIAYWARGAVVFRGPDGSESSVAVPVAATSLDLEGSRVAYGIRGCFRDRVVVQDLGDPAPALSGPAPCRAIPSDRTLTIASDRLVRLPFNCPTGCRASVQLYGHRPTADGFARTPLINGTLDVPPGGASTIVGRVPQRVMARFGCRRSLEGSVAATVRQSSAGAGGGPAGTVKRVRFVINRQRGCSQRAARRSAGR